MKKSFRNISGVLCMPTVVNGDKWANQTGGDYATNVYTAAYSTPPPYGVSTGNSQYVAPIMMNPPRPMVTSFSLGSNNTTILSAWSDGSSGWGFGMGNDPFTDIPNIAQYSTPSVNAMLTNLSQVAYGNGTGLMNAVKSFLNKGSSNNSAKNSAYLSFWASVFPAGASGMTQCDIQASINQVEAKISQLAPCFSFPNSAWGAGVSGFTKWFFQSINSSLAASNAVSPYEYIVYSYGALKTLLVSYKALYKGGCTETNPSCAANPSCGDLIINSCQVCTWKKAQCAIITCRTNTKNAAIAAQILGEKNAAAAIAAQQAIQLQQQETATTAAAATLANAQANTIAAGQTAQIATAQQSTSSNAMYMVVAGIVIVGVVGVAMAIHGHTAIAEAAKS